VLQLDEAQKPRPAARRFRVAIVEAEVSVDVRVALACEHERRRVGRLVALPQSRRAAAQERLVSEGWRRRGPGKAGGSTTCSRREGAMSSPQLLFDAAAISSCRGPVANVRALAVSGRRRSSATMPGHNAGHAPRNKRMVYPADPPTVDEIVAVMRRTQPDRHGVRLRALSSCCGAAGSGSGRRCR
jgi:hypothetical protein